MVEQHNGGNSPSLEPSTDQAWVGSIYHTAHERVKLSSTPEAYAIKKEGGGRISQTSVTLHSKNIVF